MNLIKIYKNCAFFFNINHNNIKTLIGKIMSVYSIDKIKNNSNLASSILPNFVKFNFYFNYALLNDSSKLEIEFG